MARKSGPRQLKREPAPGFWPIRRKEMAWAPMTRPGPHRRDRSLPLVIVIREILGYARTAKEAIHIISTGRVKVDGVVRRDHRFPVGLMDVLQIEGSPQSFRVLPRPDLILQAREPRQKPGEEYAVGGAIQLGLPEQKIVGHIPFQTGAIGLVVDGRNQGHFGKIFSITPGTHARRKGVRIETTDEAFETPAAYVIPIGMGTPLIGRGKQ